jgi:hypothetical protein
MPYFLGVHLYQPSRDDPILPLSKKYEEIYTSVNFLKCTWGQYSMIMRYDSHCVIRMLAV